MQYFASKAAWDQADWQEVACQIEDVFYVIWVPKLFDDIVQNDLQMILPQVVRTAYTDVEIDVFRQRRNDYAALDESFDQQIVDLVAECGLRLSELRMVTADEFIADIDRRVRPGTLGQVLDNFADPLFAFDQDDVSLTNMPLQGGEIVRKAKRVVLERFGEEPGELTDHEPASCIPGRKEK